MAAASGIVWSIGALTARLAAGSDTWQYLIARSIGIIVVIEFVALWQRRPSPLVAAYTSGASMMAGNAALLGASLCFVYALKNTTAANAAFLASVTPLFAAVLGRVVLHERLNRVTIAATAVATAGLLVMVVADLGTGSMRGNLAAVCSSVAFAAYTICLRSNRSMDWSPVLPGYAAMMIVICGAVTVVHHKALIVSFHDLALGLIHGGLLIVVGTLLYNAASRSVPAVAMTVLAQGEAVFVPVWIFLWFGERPGAATLIGGMLVLGAVAGAAILNGRERVAVV